MQYLLVMDGKDLKLQNLSWKGLMKSGSRDVSIFPPPSKLQQYWILNNFNSVIVQSFSTLPCFSTLIASHLCFVMYHLSLCRILKEKCNLLQ